MAKTENPDTTDATVDADEIARFEEIAAEWWDENGKFKPLHRLNPTRVSYIRNHICSHFGLDAKSTRPMAGLKVLDIGCGGGLVCEPLKRMGADVTGIDAGAENIEIAKQHASESGLDIEYQAITAEKLARAEYEYDVVLALEIAEHVADIGLFIETATQLVKPGGMIVMSTLNRTLKGFLLGVVVAERVAKWLPKGTHDWKKFLKPSELARHMRNHRVEVVDVTGMVYNPMSQSFSLSRKDNQVNYLLTGVKTLGHKAEE